MQNVDKKRVLYFDILNIVACFCVIWLHCNGIVHKFSQDRAWATSLIVETIAYWAVPVFFMLTGATLMNYRKKYDTKTFFKKRVLKTVIPFFIWSIIIIIWKYFTNRLKIQSFSIINIFNIIIANKQESVYWFFWALFSVYISLPILSLFTEEKYRKYLWYMVIVSAIFNSISMLTKMVGIIWNSQFNFPIASGPIMYVILGYLISTEDISKKKRYGIYIMGLLALVLRYGVTYYLSIRDNRINNTFFGYYYFTALFYSLAIFVLFKYINFNKFIKSDRAKKIISKVSSCSFGIYLIHKIVMTYEIKFFNIDTHCWQWRTVGAILTYLICLMIVYIIKNIPLLRKIVP